MLAEQIGERIRIIRESKQITLSQLANRCGMAKSYLSDLENNKSSNPSVDKLSRICEVLEIEVDSLLPIKMDESLQLEWANLVRKAQSIGITPALFAEFIEVHLNGQRGNALTP